MKWSILFILVAVSGCGKSNFSSSSSSKDLSSSSSEDLSSSPSEDLSSSPSEDLSSSPSEDLISKPDVTPNVELPESTLVCLKKDNNSYEFELKPTEITYYIEEMQYSYVNDGPCLPKCQTNAYCVESLSSGARKSADIDSCKVDSYLSSNNLKIINEGQCQPLSCKVVGSDSNKKTHKNMGSYYRHEFLHQNAAVDPGNTQHDPSALNHADSKSVDYYGILGAYETDSTILENTTYTLYTKALIDLLQQGVEEIEFTTFAHQFGSGLDQITLSIDTKGNSTSYPSYTNIYGVQQALRLTNLSLKNGVVTGDVYLYELNFTTSTDFSLYVSGKIDSRDFYDLTAPMSKILSDGKVSGAHLRSSAKSLTLNDAQLVASSNSTQVILSRVRAFKAII